MQRGHQQLFHAPDGLLDIEDCIDARGEIVLPPGTSLVSLIERNVVHVGDSVAYRFLDFARSEGDTSELTWCQLDVRMRAIGALIQQAVSRTDRVAIMAPQGLDYVTAFFAVLKAGAIAVPLFAPELPGHAVRLEVALGDAEPALLLTTRVATDAVYGFLRRLPGPAPSVIVIDEVPDAASAEFRDVDIGMDDISHLQYTSGATRAPAGIEITHRAFVTNLVQMILSIDLLNRNTHGVSWLPLYHDMGLSMIGFPATYGGHCTLMAPTAFVRRPERWIRALSDASGEGRVVTAAPNFAYQWAAQRGKPAAGEDIDLSNVVMIIGSEPVSMARMPGASHSGQPVCWAVWVRMAWTTFMAAPRLTIIGTRRLRTRRAPIDAQSARSPSSGLGHPRLQREWPACRSSDTACGYGSLRATSRASCLLRIRSFRCGLGPSP